jgi:outer membrane murein-binding lipoprotein Lpp
MKRFLISLIVTALFLGAMVLAGCDSSPTPRIQASAEKVVKIPNRYHSDTKAVSNLTSESPPLAVAVLNYTGDIPIPVSYDRPPGITARSRPAVVLRI